METIISKFVLGVAIILSLMGCGAKPDGAKPPAMTFSVQGASVSVSGTLKPGAKVSAVQAKAAMKVPVQMLDSRK